MESTNFGPFSRPLIADGSTTMSPMILTRSRGDGFVFGLVFRSSLSLLVVRSSLSLLVVRSSLSLLVVRSSLSLLVVRSSLSMLVVVLVATFFSVSVFLSFFRWILSEENFAIAFALAFSLVSFIAMVTIGASIVRTFPLNTISFRRLFIEAIMRYFSRINSERRLLLDLVSKFSNGPDPFSFREILKQLLTQFGVGPFRLHLCKKVRLS